MSRVRPLRLLAVMTALAVALVWALPGRSVAAPLHGAAATAAASYVAAQLKTDATGTYLETVDFFSGQPVPSPSTTTEGVLALVAAGGHTAEVAAMDAWLKKQAVAYGTSAGAAAKLALAAVAAGSDPRSYGGVDLITTITSAADAQGSLSAWGPDGFGQSLGVLALVRSGVTVPPAIAAYLIGLQDADGSFGYLDYSTGAYVADPDTTALALQAVAGLAGGDPAAKFAAVKARDWLVAHRTAGGYWDAYSPSNTTGYAGIALMLVQSDVSASVAWLAGQQRPDGGLPASLGGTSSDLYATVQGMLLFAGESLLSVGPGGTDRVSLATTGTTAPATSAPVSSAPVSSAPVSSAPVNSAPASSAPVSSRPVSSAPGSSRPVSSAPVSSRPVSSAPVSSAPVRSTAAVTAAGSITAPTVRQGGTLTVTGTGFSSTVRGTVRSDPVDLGTQQPDSSGTVRFTFTTADLAPGAHTVTLRSEESTVVVAFTVVGPSTLASAGADVPPAALAGAIVALVAGIGLLVSSRRRAR